ncbi:RNA polymerase sigma factor SigJ [Pseudomaricurvus sp. HS19]|uniref:RNA polymerase sigma factor SigJ n=1 Tax=Pseudomaricurvus sp. HS19 TaxID=2692626 RepID=UPI001367CD01|nr:RNA polymerase sigma factor SigJ [Pseudomaricurvus sp. HS19]MYM63040.1 sigma-70 family RNA polymerase sigma factor [Pseudomaricurvus sp. HS19]
MALASFQQHRSRLLGLAYRMLGSRADAEDILQEAWLRWSAAQHTQTDAPVDNAQAYLTTIVTRLSLDRLKAERVRRDAYIGPWLPDPVSDVGSMDLEAATELADDLSYALLLTLERLSAPERAAFLLHDVFDLPFSEVAAVLERNEASVRQLASRARKAVRAEQPDRSAPEAEHRRLLGAFMRAAAEGDSDTLTSLLREDAVFTADSGGYRLAARRPIAGAEKIVRLFLGVANKFRPQAQVSAEWLTTNGAPALLLRHDGEPEQLLSVSVRDGRIAAIYLLNHPQKLRALCERL